MEGPQLPEGMEVTALSLFQLFFDDKAVERIITCTFESKKMEKRQRYNLFTCRTLSKEEVIAFIGVLILLGIS